MIKRIAILSMFFLVCSPVFAKDEPVSVRHLSPTGEVFKEGYYPHMWFYRTEITNNTDSPLRVVWFDAHIEVEGKWYASNILGRVMRSPEFTSWYKAGDKINNGVILPGQTAACDVNWHGGNTEKYIKTKWSYILIDEKGNDYFVEKEVDPLIVDHMTYGPDVELNKPLWD